MKWMWIMMAWLVATPALAENELELIPRLGVGTENLEGGFWTYGRLEIVETHGIMGGREQVAPIIGGIGLEVSSNWDNTLSFGFSTVGGSRMAYASMGGAVLWNQDKRKPFDGGATVGLHAPMFSATYMYTVRGERVALMGVVLDAKFWMRLVRNQQQFDKEMTSRSDE